MRHFCCLIPSDLGGSLYMLADFFFLFSNMHKFASALWISHTTSTRSPLMIPLAISPIVSQFPPSLNLFFFSHSFYLPSVSLHLSLSLPSHHSPPPPIFSSPFPSLSPCHSSGCTKQGLGVIEVLTWEFFRRGLLSSAVPQRDLSLLGFSSRLGLASPRTPHGNSLSSCLCALSPEALVPFPDRCVAWPW